MKPTKPIKQLPKPIKKPAPAAVNKPLRSAEEIQSAIVHDKIRVIQKGLIELAADVGVLKDKVLALEQLHQQPSP